MKKIIFYGILGEKFGKEFVLDVQTASEAIRALCKQIKGLEEYVKLNNFVVWADEENLSEETVKMTFNAEVFKFSLDIDGAGGGGGLLSIVAGVAMVAVGFVLGGPIGAGLILGGIVAGAVGISMSLMPVAYPDTLDEEGNRASYSFGGAVTTTAQGNVIPVSYGECMGGGFVMSAGVKTRNILY